MSRAALYCLLANVLAGSTFAAMDAAHESGLPTVTFTFLRTLLSTLLFAALAWRQGCLAPRFSARDWGLLALVGIPGFALPLVVGIRGVGMSTAGLGSILALLEPIMIVPLSVLFLRERLPAARVVGIALGVAGALLVVGGDALAGIASDGGTLTGNALLALQGSLWAVYTVAAKPLVDRHDVTAISTWSTALGCLVLGLLAPLEWPDVLHPGAGAPVAEALALERGPADAAAAAAALRAALAPMLYLAIGGSFLGVLLWNAGLKGVAASRMAGFIFVQPAVGLLLDALCGARLPSLPAWCGLAAIAVAVRFVSREPATP